MNELPTSASIDKDIFCATANHFKLLYLIAEYTAAKKGLSGDDGKAKWIRKVPLLVLIYEGIIQDVFDYDYAPSSEVIGVHRMYMNISQEGKDDVDDLREAGLINGLKLSTSEYQSITAYQITRQGVEHLANIKPDAKDQVDSFIKKDGILFHVSFENKEFTLKAGDFQYTSSVIDSEDVSYVSSPYLPECLRVAGGRPTTSNAHRALECTKGKNNIRDSSMEEIIVLSNVHVLVGEWIPFGSNQIIALIDKLGATERVKGGLFTALIDSQPDGMTFTVPDDVQTGMTSVDILDFQLGKHLNFEAEVFFEEGEGIVQIEDFGVHLSHDGTTILGLKIEALMDRDKTSISLDYLARVLADIHQDSSKILASLMTSYQRSLLDMMYAGDALARDKFSCFMADNITPRLAPDKYMDKEDNENELNQVLGALHSVHDLGNGELLFLGGHGLLFVGELTTNTTKAINCFLSLMGREIFISNFFHRTFTLRETLENTRVMINSYETHPNAIEKIRFMLSKASKDQVLLREVLSYIGESLQNNQIDDQVTALAKVLNLTEQHSILVRRVQDLNKNIEGIQHELDGLREMTDVISETTMFKLQESLQANTKSLSNVFESSERSSSSLEIMQVVLSGTLAFEILDRLTGEWSVMETTWGKQYIHDPFIERPGVWFIVNLALWAFIGWILKVITAHLTEKSSGIITVRFRPNLPINLEALQLYLNSKELGEEEVGIDSKQKIQKVGWVDNGNVCKDKETKIEISWDAENGFLLTCFMQITKGKTPLTGGQLETLLLQELEKHKILEKTTI